MAHAIPVRDIKIIYLVCAIVALLFTLFRLWLRVRRAKLWWDDAFALLAAISTCLSAAAGWMHFDAEDFDSRTTKVAAYYMIALCFYVALWPARLSILYTIVRISPFQQMKRYLYCAAIVMGIMWATLFAQIFWVCAPMPSWMLQPAPQCPLPRQVGVLQLVSDILADGFLIAVPIRFFLNTELKTSLKMRLVIVFGSSILTTIVSLVHTYYVLKVGGADVLIAAMVEIAVSVIVCNLSVVVTSFFIMFSKRQDFSEDLDTEHITTFGARTSSKRRMGRKGDISTIGLSELTIKTEIDIGGVVTTETRRGQLDVPLKGPMVYYETHTHVDQPKGYLLDPPDPQGVHWET